MLKTSASRECSVWWGVKLEELLDFWQVHSFFSIGSNCFCCFALCVFMHVCVLFTFFRGLIRFGRRERRRRKKNISKKETIITFARTDFYRLITFRVHNDGALRPIMPYVYDETPSGLCTYCIYCSAPEEQKKSRGDEMYAQTLDGERCPIQRKK
jgi:hypothetical protein